MIDGLTGDQRFFLAWAQVWRAQQREEAAPPAAADRSAQPGGVPRQRRRPQFRRLVQGVRRDAGRRALPAAGAARPHLVVRARLAMRGRRRSLDLRRPCFMRPRRMGPDPHRHPARHRRGSDRIPAGVLDRPPDPRAELFGYDAGAMVAVQHRDPARRDPGGGGTSTGDLFWDTGHRPAAARGRSGALRAQHPARRSCPRRCIGLSPRMRSTSCSAARWWSLGADRRRHRDPRARARPSSRSPRTRASPNCRCAPAIGVGLAQCLAMIPGTSRSGATILGALAMGVGRKTAAEFSFFLAVPTMLGAATLKLLDDRDAARRRGGDRLGRDRGRLRRLRSSSRWS